MPARWNPKCCLEASQILTLPHFLNLKCLTIRFWRLFCQYRLKITQTHIRLDRQWGSDIDSSPWRYPTTGETETETSRGLEVSLLTVTPYLLDQKIKATIKLPRSVDDHRGRLRHAVNQYLVIVLKKNTAMF